LQAIKEQQVQIEALKAQNQKLQEALDSTNKKLARFESALQRVEAAASAANASLAEPGAE